MLDRTRGRAAARALLVACVALAVPFAARAEDVKLDSDALEGLHIRNLGPAAMSGRISAIDGVAGDRLTLWIGTAGGGVWRSRDGGTTFKPMFDKHTQSIGAVRVDPKHPKTVWVGTGESWTRNSVSIGDGVYKSTDDGDSWMRMGLEKTERIARIAVNPQHPDTVYVAATGALWNASPERGVFRTHDGGKTWEKVLFVNDDTGAADLAIDPQNPSIVYAAMWQFRRKPWTFSSGGPGSGLYKSTDGGDHWSRLTNGLPAGDLGRIAIGLAPSRPSRIYALVEAKKTALFRTDDLGEHWTEVNTSQNVVIRPFYFAHLVVDPSNFDRVYKPGLSLTLSEDGGKTFAGSGFGGGPHSDFHAVWINPKDPEQVVVGTDGGVYISEDRASHWRLCPNLPVGQFYHVSYDMKWPYNVYGGLQDNGSWVGPSRHAGGIPNRLWSSLLGGDGMWAFVDPKDEDIAFVEYQGGNISRVVQSTGETKNIKPTRKADEPEYRFNWNTPVHLSPTRAGTMYLGAQFLFRSTDRGDTWDRISPDLTTNDKTKQEQDKSGGLSVDNSSAENHTTIYAISESPKNPELVWVGTDDGNLQLTRDGGKTWANVVKKVPGLPANAWVSMIEASHFDEGTAYVSFENHMAGDFQPYVYRTTDFGATWTALATSDLHGYAFCVREDLVRKDLLFVGTELGLFTSIDGGRSWAQLEAGLPNVAVRDLAIHPREGDLLIATHGRGLWILDDLSALRSLTQKVLESDVAFLDSRPSWMIIPSGEQRFDGDTEFYGDSPDETATITYYLKKRHMFGDCRIEIVDTDGKLISSLAGGKRRGINRVDWPMRMKPPKVPPAANLVPQQFAFVGPRVPAGSYTVKLIKNKDTFTSKVELVPDPRSTHSAADRVVQQQTALTLYRMMETLTYTADAMTDLQEQARKQAEGLKKGDALATKLNGFADRLENLRKSIVTSKEGRLSGEEKLREKLGTLYGSVNGYDGHPTNSQLSFMGVMKGELEKAQAEFETLAAKETPALNAQLKSRKLAELVVPTREAWDKKQEKS